MEIDVSNAIAGIDELLTQVEQNITAAASDQALRYVFRLQGVTSYHFQTVPSYLLQYKFKSSKVAARKYPEGTVSTFARSGGAIDRQLRVGNLEVFSATGADNIIIQQFGSPGPLHKLLQASQTRVERAGSAVKIAADVGYPQGVGEDLGTEHISFLYFGTDKMVARPFIEEVVYAHSNDFRQAVIKAAQDAINSATQKGAGPAEEFLVAPGPRRGPTPVRPKSFPTFPLG